MNFTFTTQLATFLERPNRYLVVARLQENGVTMRAHCPDPGRLGELLIPGVTVHVSKANHAERKTAYDLRFVEHPEHGQLISLDTRLPNQIFAEGLQNDFFAPFRGHQRVDREVSLSGISHEGVRSRIDFRLVDASGAPCWVEVKSATLVVERCAYFPDAVTARGKRHLEELLHIAQGGERTAVVFIVQRPDADQLRPQWKTDPEFSQALVNAQAGGVELYAYTCALSRQRVTLERHIPVEISIPQ